MATYINFEGELTTESGNMIVDQLLNIRCRNEEVLMANDRLKYQEDLLPLHEDVVIFRVNSEGGNLFKLIEIFELIDVLKHQGVRFIAEVGSHAYSAAFYLLMKMDEVYLSKYATLMYHQMSLALSLTRLNDLELETKRMMKIQNKLDQLVLENTKISKELLEEYKGKDLWLDYDDAVKYGIEKKGEINKIQMTKEELDSYLQLLTEGIEIVEDEEDYI